MIGGEETPPLGEEAADARRVCGHGGSGGEGKEEDEEGSRRRRAQTTWITGLKGRPDRVNLNNSEQKTASLLTSPRLHFQWQSANKHILPSRTFKRSFSLGFSTKLKGFFFSFPTEKRESGPTDSKTQVAIFKNMKEKSSARDGRSNAGAV